jgi:vacuolar-type H+-ATPase subunit E/Vma4
LGLEELIKTLRANRQSQIDEIWQAAKAEAASLRQQTSSAISDFTEDHTDSLVCNCKKSIRTIISEAETRAKKIKLMALDSLRNLLHKAAIEQLHNLRNDDCGLIFKKLVQELPEQEWETITVNPDDISKTENVFKNCTIQTDPTISGGMVAESMNGKIVVNNTFLKRLERSWSTLFPAIVRELETEYVESGNFTESTSK